MSSPRRSAPAAGAGASLPTGRSTEEPTDRAPTDRAPTAPNPNRRSALRRLLGGAVGLGGLVLVPGCGFRPMTAGPGGAGTGRTLATSPQAAAGVYVHPVVSGAPDATALGQDLRNALINRFGLPDRPAYALRLTLDRQDSGRGYTLDARATRITVTGRVRFAVFRLDPANRQPPQLAFSGTETAWSSFDAIEAPFADTMARRRAERLVADSLAAQIDTRLSAWIAAPNRFAAPDTAAPPAGS